MVEIRNKIKIMLPKIAYKIYRYANVKRHLKELAINYRYRKLINSIKELQTADKIFTHLTKEEKLLLYNLASKVRDGYALEIGSYLGASACFISAGLKGSSKLICVDTWKNDAMSEGPRDTYEEFVKNTKNFSEKIIMVRGFSFNVVEDVKRITNAIDLLFIDGDHSYQAVKKDVELYFPLLKKGGAIIFHDIGWAEGVKKVVEEIKPYLENYGSLPNMFWGYKK